MDDVKKKKGREVMGHEEMMAKGEVRKKLRLFHL